MRQTHCLIIFFRSNINIPNYVSIVYWVTNWPRPR